MRVIAFCGPKTCGKDTAAKTLLRHNQGGKFDYFRKAGFAEGVKNYGQDFFGWTHEQMDDPIFKETPRPLWQGGPEIEPRWFMMDEANGLRDRYSPEIHARRWERLTLKQEGLTGCTLVTDLRFPPEEVDAIRRIGNTSPGTVGLGSLIVYVHRQAAEDSLTSAQEAMDAKALNASEAHYKALRELADVVITNDGEIHELNNRVNALVHTHFGHWTAWPVDPRIGAQ